MSGDNVRLDTPFPLISRATGTFNSDGNAMPESFSHLLIMADVTVAGTSLDLRYQVSPDEGVTWFTRDSVAQITAVGQFVHAITDTIGSFYRIQKVIAGGPFISRVRVEFKR